VACSINRTIVPKNDFSGRRLQDHDRIDILQIIGGG